MGKEKSLINLQATETVVDDRKIIDANQLNVDCITSNNNKFSLDSEGNMSVKSITSEKPIGTITFNDIYPVGSIYLSVNGTNPTNYFWGTWTLFGEGRTLVCVSSNEGEFNTVEKTGGEKYHTLSEDEMPNHQHGNIRLTKQYFITAWNDYKGNAKAFNIDGDYHTNVSNYGGGVSNSFDTDFRGGDKPHNNMMPYITCYIWKRVA